MVPPDMQRPWIGPAVRATLELCSRRRPDVLWATGPPWSAFVVAERVAKRTGIPYVLDFRTSWTIVPSPFEAIRPGWAQRADRRQLRRLLAGAQAVTFFYPAEAECFWRLYKGALDVSRVHVIPNGFDGDVEPYVDPATTSLKICTPARCRTMGTKHSCRRSQHSWRAIRHGRRELPFVSSANRSRCYPACAGARAVGDRVRAAGSASR